MQIIRKTNHHRCNAGFTLLELLVVIIILTIVTAIALMSFGDFGQQRKLRMSLQQLSDTIALAQQQAILQPSTLRLQFTQHGYQVLQYSSKLSAQSTTTQWQTISHDQLSESDAFPQKTFLKITFQNKNSKAIIFEPNGLVTPFVLAAWLTPDDKLCLYVNSSGTTKIQSCPGAEHD